MAAKVIALPRSRSWYKAEPEGRRHRLECIVCWQVYQQSLLDRGLSSTPIVLRRWQ